MAKLKNFLSSLKSQGHDLVGNISSQILPPQFRLGHSAYRKVSSCAPFGLIAHWDKKAVRHGTDDTVHPRNGCNSQDIYCS